MAGSHIATLYPPVTRYGTDELAALAVLAAVLRLRFGVRRLLVRGRPCDQ